MSIIKKNYLFKIKQKSLKAFQVVTSAFAVICNVHNFIVHAQ